jgi:hypothetical protein
MIKHIWSCINCRNRVETHCDFHINERPVCVQCNAEMEPFRPGTPIAPNWKDLAELAARVLLQHMNDEDYEMSFAGLYARLTEHVVTSTGF